MIFLPPSSSAAAGACIVTPTRDRPQALGFCEEWLRRQTWEGTVRWVVVCDGSRDPELTLPHTLIRLPPSGERNTFLPNLLSGLEAAHGMATFVFIVEDDDWYQPDYFRVMVETLLQFRAAGIGRNVQYHLAQMRYDDGIPNGTHSSLSSTAFRVSELPRMIEAVRQCREKAYVFPDMVFWDSRDPLFCQDAATGLAPLLPLEDRDAYWVISQDVNNPLHVGLKAWPGTGNSGWHFRRYRMPRVDPQADKLKHWIGEESARAILAAIGGHSHVTA